MKQSRIYKELDKNEKEKIIKTLYGHQAKIKKCVLLKGGLFNTTYHIQTSTDEEGIVLRAAPVNRHLLFEYEKDMMSVEPLFHQILAKHQIPTTKVIQYAKHGEVIDREYIIMKYMDALPMNHASLEKRHLTKTYDQVGQIIKQLHRITNERFGWKRFSQWGEYKRWSDFLLAYGTEISEKVSEYRLFKKNDVRRLNEILIKNIDLLDEIKTPSMIHNDLWEGNVLVKKEPENQCYEVAAIIDMDRAVFGDKTMEFSNGWMTDPSFSQGYGHEKPLLINEIKRNQIYKLLNMFFGAYVWKVQYDHEERFQEKKENIIQLLYSK